MPTTSPTTPLTSAHPTGLTPDQVRLFHERGFLGPFTAIPEEEMPAITDHCAKLVTGDDSGMQQGHNRYLDDEIVHRIATEPAITACLKPLMGDALLWRTHFWNKDPGGKEIPWHQDYAYWPLEPAIVVSAWFAFDAADPANSCVNLIPGSHRHIRPHVPIREEHVQFGQMADLTDVDVHSAVSMTMRPGQFFLFTERLLHQSNVNRSDRRRLGMALRYISPLSRVMDYDSNGPQPHEVELVVGEDRLGFNRLRS